MEKETARMKKISKKTLKSIGRICILIAIVAGIAVPSYLIMRHLGLTEPSKFAEFRERMGDSMAFWMAVWGIETLQIMLVPISNQMLAAVLALLFPSDQLWKVMVCSTAAIWTATMMMYLIGRFGGKKALGWILGDKETADRCASFVKRGWYFYPICMILPLPDDVIAVLAGTSRMNIWFIALSSLLTNALDAAIAVYGIGLLNKHWWGWPIAISILIALGIGTWLLFRRERRRSKEEKAVREDAKEDSDGNNPQILD